MQTTVRNYSDSLSLRQRGADQARFRGGGGGGGLFGTREAPRKSMPTL